MHRMLKKILRSLTIIGKLHYVTIHVKSTYFLGTCSAADTLRNMEDFLQEKRDDYVAKLEERATWQRANFCMIYSTESWAFIGAKN